MKTRILVCLVAVLCMSLAAGVARADGVVDPKITLGGGGSCAQFSQNSLTQSFTGLPTGCQIDFTNNIGFEDEEGITLHTLVVNVTSPFDGPLSCELGEGAPLSGDPAVSSPTSCTFSDPITELASITPGLTYSLLFDTNFGDFVDITLSQTVISAPEPSSLLLLGSGLAALLWTRKRRK